MQIKKPDEDVYEFQEQLKIGEENERLLDSYFSKYYKIQSVTMELQKRGIDRLFIDGNRILKVEYKADYKAIKTGNVFIETYSVKPIKKGWSLTSESDFILYYIIGDSVYVMPTGFMREKLDIWEFIYKKANCKNKEYESEGILVPLGDIRKIFKSIVID